jgi:hypothetical protein
MEFELGKVIANRSLEATDKHGSKFEVRIMLGIPANIPGSRDIYVPYQIDHSGQSRSWYAAGIDGFQALQLAMKMILIEIESLEREKGINVVWGKDLI